MYKNYYFKYLILKIYKDCCSFYYLNFLCNPKSMQGFCKNGQPENMQ